MANLIQPTIFRRKEQVCDKLRNKPYLQIFVVFFFHLLNCFHFPRFLIHQKLRDFQQICPNLFAPRRKNWADLRSPVQWILDSTPEKDGREKSGSFDAVTHLVKNPVILGWIKFLPTSHLAASLSYQDCLPCPRSKLIAGHFDSFDRSH